MGVRAISQDYFQWQIKDSIGRMESLCVTHIKSPTDPCSFFFFTKVQGRRCSGTTLPWVSLPRPRLSPVVPSCSACVLWPERFCSLQLFPAHSAAGFALLCFAAGVSHYCAARWWRWPHWHVPCDSPAVCPVPRAVEELYFLCSLDAFLIHRQSPGRQPGERERPRAWEAEPGFLSPSSFCNQPWASSFFSLHFSFFIC